MQEHRFVVLTELSLHAKVNSWDLDSQIELNVLQDLVREGGLDILKDIPSICSVEREIVSDKGRTERLDVWFKMRSSWTFFSLAVRAPNVILFQDSKRRAPK